MKKLWILVIGFSILGIGCGPFFSVLSVPPPGKKAELITGEENQITLSKGIALAIECEDRYRKACENLSLSLADETVAKSYDSYLDSLSTYYSSEGFYGSYKRQSPSVFVIVGLSEGNTTLDVETDDSETQFVVTVLDDY